MIFTEPNRIAGMIKFNKVELTELKVRIFMNIKYDQLCIRNVEKKDCEQLANGGMTEK